MSIEGMTVFNPVKTDPREQTMFFGQPLGIQQYTSFKYPVFDKRKNYSGSNILKKKKLIEFIEKNFLKELKTLKKAIIIPLGNTVSSTIEYLNSKYNLKLTCFLKGFPHPSGANARKNIQFKENRSSMMKLLKSNK